MGFVSGTDCAACSRQGNGTPPVSSRSDAAYAPDAAMGWSVRVAMDEALYDTLVYREFAGLGGMSRLPDREHSSLSTSA
jgi:hypothetical protein